MIQHPLHALLIGSLELDGQLRVLIQESLGGAEACVRDHSIRAGGALPLGFKAECPAHILILCHGGSNLGLDQSGVFRLPRGQKGGYLCGTGVDHLDIFTHRQAGLTHKILGERIRRRGLKRNIYRLALQVAPGCEIRIGGHKVRNAPGVHIHQTYIKSLIIEGGYHGQGKCVQVMFSALDHSQKFFRGIPHIQVNCHILPQQLLLHHVKNRQSRRGSGHAYRDGNRFGGLAGFLCCVVLVGAVRRRIAPGTTGQGKEHHSRSQDGSKSAFHLRSSNLNQYNPACG